MADEIVISDDNYQDHITPPPGMKMGCIPRDYAQFPVGYLMCAKPFNIPLIPPDKQQVIFDAQVANKARLSDIRNVGANGKPIPSRDQNGKGYCWFHSGTSAALLSRARDGEPYVDLSAYAGACIIKGYRDEGGMGSEGVEWVAENGIPSSQYWPQQSMSRSNDTPAMRANAAMHKWTDWIDLDPRNIQQLITCLLYNIPVVCDFNWWGHSVCGMDVVSLNPFSLRIWNSWGDSWSENGTGILTGNKAIPDAMIAPKLALASAA